MKVTYNNVKACEDAGLVGLIAFSPQTGQRENIPPTSEWLNVSRMFPDTVMLDSKGNDFVIAMSTTDILVTAVIDEMVDIILDYAALDHLNKRGYF